MPCESDNVSQKTVTKTIITELVHNCFGLDFDDGMISKDDFGKPFFNNIDAQISISHTKGLCAVALLFDGKKYTCNFKDNNLLVFDTNFKNIGIDVELIDYQQNTDKLKKISNKYFSKKEIDSLLKIKSDSQLIEEFTKIWTIKESICKMKGLGLKFISKAIVEDFEETCFFKSEKIEFIDKTFYLSVCTLK